ncbi:hypothetical protein ASPSYDRAFT_26931 [Aspergillus sydowii CBS 593.65]|uniref:Uncharacterized protein n=1 Tax=Aspergillus sydowii CBS 593.65 TaxID=1036612 RepID=A0A1L9TZU6_9EURO|nr:uncharacterized protein ASPSYDRAFT_26931 [Aspergillus sydowii CBS 593.65]OJJ64964.1 hypothetical protein ASPSYDRAFT_26931 [Aspergillus sydowii CBS 593.65]
MPGRRQSLTERIHNLAGSRRSSQPASPRPRPRPPEAEGEDYTLFIGRLREPTLTGTGDFALILLGQKTKICESTYKYMNSQGEWKTMQDLKPGFLRCDKSMKKTKVGIIKAGDRLEFEAAIRDAEVRGALDRDLGKGGELGPGKGFAVRVLLCCWHRKVLSWDDVQLYMTQPGRNLSPSEKASFYEDLWN